MNLYILLECLKYLDFYGTKFSFYIEKKRKIYTPIGGILTLFSIILGSLVFIFIEKDDFLHKTPISTTSVSKAPYTKITFLKEKIWVPWRIRDYNSKTINFTNLIYPIAFYYKCIFNETKNHLDVSYSIINYRLCNETSMAMYKDLYILDIDLDKVYCFDMDDLLMGGNGDLDYIYYVQFDLYSCKNGIDYDENNPNCSTYEKIIEAAGENNSFSIDLFYPVVHYQPMVKNNPLFIRYNNYYYHLSRYSNKIDRLYLQKYILKDDEGLISKNEKITTHWGYSSFSGDTYSTGDKRDLMNEGSSSRLYSFNIFINYDVVNYNRSYKKLFIIIANGLPNVNAVFMILKIFAKIIGLAYGNDKLTQLFFENLQEKSNGFKDIKSSVFKLYGEKNTQKNKINNNNLKISKLNIKSSRDDKKDGSSLQLYLPNDENREINKNIIFKRKNSKLITELPKLNNKELRGNKNNDDISSSHSNRLNFKKILNVEDKDKNIKSIKISLNKTYYVKQKLFPFRYYLCSIFFKNIGISKKSIFFHEDFVLVYNYICHLIDISSYLMLQKELQILKNILILKKYKPFIENTEKVNINDKSFDMENKECLEYNRFSILGKPKNYNDKK